MTLKIPGVADTALPRDAPFLHLVRGADVYCEVRPGTSIDLATDTGTVKANVVSVGVGPLLNHFGTELYGQGRHFAVPQGQDNRAMVDYLESVSPKDPKAIDPRTIYSALTLQVSSLG